MTVRAIRHVVLFGLGALAGAVLPASAAAQLPVTRDSSTARRDTVPARRDTMPIRRDTARGQVRLPGPPITVPLPARADSMIRNDSAAKGILGQKEQRVVDTLKAPTARAEAPATLEIGTSRVYDRQAIYATGALTLSDLLSRVPGLTGYATGWLVAPTGVASEGDFRAIRIFVDGIEIDPMDQREQGRAPVNDVPLHMLEEIRIERGAEQVRVYARTWRVNSTTPYTRADVLTGDQNTNLYRGYFGRRYSHGEVLQVSAEQASAQPLSGLPSSNEQSFMLRFGTAQGPWSADVLAMRNQTTRDVWTGQGNIIQFRDTIPPLAAKRTAAYLRLANGDPDASRWIQLVASSHGFLGNPATNSADTLVSRDSGSYENQYLLTGGVRRGPLRLSAAERVRVATGVSSYVPSARGSLETGPLAVSLLAEGRSPFQPTRVEGTVRTELLQHVSALASASRTGGGTFSRVVANGATTPLILLGGGYSDLPLGPVFFDSSTSIATRYQLAARTNARAELGLRVGELWLTGGVMRRGATVLLPAAGLGSGYSPAAAVVSEGAATGQTVALRGRVWRAIQVDAWGVAWNDTAGLYRPRYQSRAELFIRSNLLEHFPRGNFGILGSVAHEYRSNSLFMTADDSVRTAMGSRTLDFRLEIRIQTAVISYQFRNLLQQSYAQVPGFNLPRQSQFYGVRWDFFN